QYKIFEQKDNYPTFLGNQFEIPLRNKMLTQSMARDLIDWINQNASFKTILGENSFPKQVLIENAKADHIHIQSEIEFTADGLGITQSNRYASYPVIFD